MDCKHRFHLTCIMGWFQNKRNCPVCRREDWFMPHRMERKYELEQTSYEYELSDCPSEPESEATSETQELPTHFRQYRPQ